MPSYITRRKGRPINFATKSAKGRVQKLTVERLYNCYVEAQQQGAIAPAGIIGAPGMNPIVTLPSDSDRRVRGIEIIDGNRIFAITDSNFYEVLSNTSVQISSITIRGRVSSANNGNSIVFCDGYKVYYWTEADGVRELEVPPANAVSFIDGFYVFNQRGTGVFYILRDDVFDPTEIATAEAAPDNIITLLVDHREIWLFGSVSLEVWFNAGLADFPFQRLQGAYIEKGIAGSQLATKCNNTVYWVGHDRIVYMASGYQPIPISSNAVHLALAEEPNIEESTLYSYTQEGHNFIVINLKDKKSTWVFDTTTRQWSERGTNAFGRYPADIVAKNNGVDVMIEGKPVVGHFDRPEVSFLDLDYGLVGNELLLRDCICPPIFDSVNRIKHASLEIVMDVPIVKEAPNDDDCCNLPDFSENEWIGLSWSSDKGDTYTHNERQSFGKWGVPDERITWWKLGSDYWRSYRIRAKTRGRFGIVGGYVR